MKPVKIGITGGIGAGKSIVCKILEIIGIPVYQADKESKKLLETDPEVVERVKALLGNEAYSSGDKANRSYISSVVFNHPEKLKKLNDILHPAVSKHFLEWVSIQTNKPVLAKEAAIMFESGSDKEMDLIIVVTAPEALRIQRVKQRDGKSEEEIRKIMKEQLPEEEVIKKSNFVIVNDDHRLLVPQVIALIERISGNASIENNTTRF
jgi:dephospho-CoA kinase